MSLYQFPESLHHLRTGQRVPSTALGLCYIDIPELSPASCVTIAALWNDIPGNVDDATLGTRQIRVDGIAVLDAQQWVPTIRPGSFYRQETVADYIASGSEYSIDITSYASSDLLTWEYTLGPTAVGFGSDSSTSSDPYVVLTEPITLATPRTFSLTHIPLDTSTPVTVQGYDNGVAVTGVIPVVVTNQYTGAIQADRDLGVEFEWRASYSGTAASMPYAGYYDGDPLRYYRLDLNPHPGHVSLAPTLTVSYVSDDGLYATNQWEEFVYTDVTAETTDQFLTGIDLMHAGGIALHLAPMRCWYTDAVGVTTLVWSNPTWDSNLLSWLPLSSPRRNAPHQQTLAMLFMRPPILSHQVQSIDTRVLGGGIQEGLDLTLYPESATFFDVASCDGPPVAENGVVILRVADTLVARLGADAIRAIAQQHLAAGIVCVIEPYVSLL